jgi:antitoxin component YwqK of YwqJK toxin-antitoxin module
MKIHLYILFILINAACTSNNEVKMGKLEVYKKYYPNHQLMEYREYRNNMKNGKQIAYWDNGNKRFEYSAKNDASEGALFEWDYNGRLFHLAHYLEGHEEGVQKLWYEDGKIRANYIIRKGRRFGLLGTKNCKNVSDSIFVIK